MKKLLLGGGAAAVRSAIFAAYFFVLTPVLNTIIRTEEYEADMFGLNAARQPDGFASTALKLSDYRKIDPTPLEEAIFCDHPSGHTQLLRHALEGEASIGR